MQTNSITLNYNGMKLRYSGVFRCIFTNRPILWLINKSSFYFIYLDKPSAIILCGKQGTGKTTIAAAISSSLANLGYKTNIYDNVNSGYVKRKLQVNDTADTSALLNNYYEPSLVDIYCSQDSIFSANSTRHKTLIIELT